MANTDAGGGAGRSWSELGHDLLVCIASHLDAGDLAFLTPSVCSSWRAAARDPTPWRRLDLRDWASISSTIASAAARANLPLRRDRDGLLAGILAAAVAITDGGIESVFLPPFADESHLTYLSERNPALQYFSQPVPQVPVEEFCKIVSTFPYLRGMAVDESIITFDALLHVQHSCPHFLELRVFTLELDEAMASVISAALPRLRKLEITDCDFSSAAIMTLLEHLQELEHLDISGYIPRQPRALTEAVLEKASRLKVFLWSSTVDVDPRECPDHPEVPCTCISDQRMMEWLAEPGFSLN